MAGVYFLGTEEFNSSNNMMATVVLKEIIDISKLAISYREMIVRNPLLQTKIIECPEQNRFYWGRFSHEELERLLNFEDKQLAQKYDRETIISQYYPTNTRLPFHIAVVNDNTVVICMNHILANGRGLVFWIQKWLQYYSGEHRIIKTAVMETAWQKSIRILKKIGAFLWLPVFLIDFFYSSGKTAIEDTVDLSYAKRPAKSNDYSTKSYTINQEDTETLLRRCKQKGVTLSEYMCEVLAQALLQYDQGKRRVLLSMPMDLQPLVPYLPGETPGNLIASLPVQLFREKDMERQVKGAFKWFKRGIPYSLSRVLAAISTYEKAKKQCLEMCKKTIPERTNLGNFSLTYSNLGVISYPIMEKMVDSVYFYFKSQSILLVSSSISGKLCMEMSLSKDLYNAQEVFNLFDQVLTAEYLLK
ncbi:MAG: hypothetical protein H6Q73_2263 [Firmicutes bacterium]|nr:hypothetical protein [Bacillota bacterium]